MDELKALKPWERACLFGGMALLLTSALILAVGVELISSFPSSLRLGVPWLYVALAIVVVIALAATLRQWKEWIPVFLFFKPWSIPLLGVGWCLLVWGIALILFLPRDAQAGAPPASDSSPRPSSLLFVSGLGIYGLAFMANADRFAARHLKLLSATSRTCSKCRQVALPKEGRCPSCGDDGPRRESLKLGAFVFGGVPASAAIMAMMTLGPQLEIAAFAVGFLVWGCFGAVFYKVSRSRGAG